MNTLKLIKLFAENNDMPFIYAIYDLSDVETNPTGKRYLINKEYSDWALDNFTLKEIIKSAIRDSEYVYGVGFFDTIKECELYYDCCCLELKLRSITNKIKQMNLLGEKESIVFHHK